MPRAERAAGTCERGGGPTRNAGRGRKARRPSQNGHRPAFAAVAGFPWLRVLSDDVWDAIPWPVRDTCAPILLGLAATVARMAGCGEPRPSSQRRSCCAPCTRSLTADRWHRSRRRPSSSRCCSHTLTAEPSRAPCLFAAAGLACAALVTVAWGKTYGLVLAVPVTPLVLAQSPWSAGEHMRWACTHHMAFVPPIVAVLAALAWLPWALPAFRFVMRSC